MTSKTPASSTCISAVPAAGGPGPHASPSAARLRRSALRGLVRLLKAGVLVALPFVALVRGALFLNGEWSWNAWLAVVGGGLLSTLVLSVYAWWLWRWLTGRSRWVFLATRVIAPLVLVFCVSSQAVFATRNAKTDEVRTAYPALHPTLRLALGSLRFFDGDLVVTDIARTPGVYSAMGLRVRSRSAHYVQRDGFVHAIDLRTRGKGEIRNRLTQAWLFGLGFDTLRHGGSADHLHVSLARPRPRVKRS